MAASQPVMEAAARESRANAREDMAVLTSGAREKVDSAMASMQAFGQTVMHPLDKTKKEEAQAVAEQHKKEAKEKRDEIRAVAAQQAAVERAAARSMVAKGVSEAGGARYPVLTTDQPQDVTSSPHVLDPNYHPNHPPISDGPQNQSAADTNLDTGCSVITSPLHVPSVAKPPHDEDCVFGGSDASTEPPRPVTRPSRQDRSGEHVHESKEVDCNSVEDADHYPLPRIVQS